MASYKIYYNSAGSSISFSATLSGANVVLSGFITNDGSYAATPAPGNILVDGVEKGIGWSQQYQPGSIVLSRWVSSTSITVSCASHSVRSVTGQWWDSATVDLLNAAGLVVTVAGPVTVNGSNALIANMSGLAGGYSYEYTYQVRLSSNAASGSGTGSRVSHVVPLAWLDAGVAYGTIAVTAKYQGVVLSTRTVSWQAMPEDSRWPITVTEFTVAPWGERVPTGFTAFASGLCGARVTAAATVEKGSIALYGVKIGAETREGAVCEFPPLATAGDVAVELTVTDSWGRTRLERKTITVYAYKMPGFENVKSQRCTAAGVLADDGTSVRVNDGFTITSCGGANQGALKVYKKTTGTASWDTGRALALTGGVLGPDYVEPGKSYDLRYELSDQFNTVVFFDYVSTSTYLMHFLRGGHGVAIGKASELDRAFDVAFEAYFRDGANFNGDVSFTDAQGKTVTMAQIIAALGI